jgi:hypothetical protein
MTTPAGVRRLADYNRGSLFAPFSLGTKVVTGKSYFVNETPAHKRLLRQVQVGVTRFGREISYDWRRDL